MNMYPSSDSHRVNLESQTVSEAEDAQNTEFEDGANVVIIGNSQNPSQDEDTNPQTALIKENDSFLKTDEEPESTCLITPGLDYSNDFCFTISEDSFVLPESNYIGTSIENVQSTSYSNSKQLHISCEESTSQDPLQQCILFNDSVQAVDEDFFANNGEESSMDSGLGSVESVYPTSEDDAALSPTYFNKSEDDDEERLQTTESDRTDSGPVYDDAGSSSNATTSTRLNSCLNSFEDETPALIQSKPILKASAMKRHIEGEGNDEEGPSTVGKVRRKRKRVNFEDVTVFYFPRKQGFVSVPSQGGSTLGMAMNHSEFSTMTLTEHDDAVKNRHEEKLREHWKEQNLAKEMLQLQYINQGFQSNNITAMSQHNYCSNENPTNSVTPSLDAVDQYFFLQPVTAKKRRKLLRSAGVERIDGEEKLVNRLLRESREICGCSCEEICVPDSCECSIAGIQCQVDRESFPCGCIVSGCQNENGRIEFNPERVRNHLLATLKNLEEMEDNKESGEDIAIDSDQLSDCFSTEESAALPSNQDEMSTVRNCHAPLQEIHALPRLPDSLLRTLKLEHVGSFIQIDAENRCNTSEYTTQSSRIISDFGSLPVPQGDPTTEPNLETANSSISDVSCKTWHGQGVGLINHSGELSQPGNVFSSTNEVPNDLNESFLNIRCDRVLSLDPIDTFMSSNFVTATAPDFTGTLNLDSPL